MTPNELMAFASANPTLIGTLIAAPAVAATALQLTPPLHHPRGGIAVLWSAVVYAACVPGIFAVVALIYMAAFMRTNLMNIDLLAVFGPIASMIATLGLAGRKVNIGDLPGVDRLGGMLMMLGATFMVVFLLERTRIVVLFHGSVWTLLFLCAVLFIVFKVGMSRVFGRRDPAV